MADDKSGRDKQADDAERRQQEREIATELERGDEREPPVVTEELAELEEELKALSFPSTGTEIVAAIGDQMIASAEGSYRIEVNSSRRLTRRRSILQLRSECRFSGQQLPQR